MVFGKLAERGIQPASLSSDEVFLRRIFLDVTGSLPSAQEAAAFFASRDPNKRAALIDKLLESDSFTTYAAMHWYDLLRIKSEFPINLWPAAAQEYSRWVLNAIHTDLPYDEFARTLLTASGSNFRVGPANFYRAVEGRDPLSLARAAALSFMGARLDKWPKERQMQLAAFFSQVGYKPTGEWKEEIVFFDPGKPQPASPLILPDGQRVRPEAGQDPRELFASWLIQPRNPWFARAAVNRIWNWLLGRGLIDPVDDIRAENPPAIPEALNYLEAELIRNRWQLRPLYRTILNSAVYQLGPVARSKNADAARLFAVYSVRRIEAEVLIDTLSQITGHTEQYFSSTPEPYTILPAGQSAVALPDGGISSSFLELFGRSARNTGLDEERNNKPTPQQRLHLLNSTHMEQSIEQGPALATLLNASDSRAAAVGLYLAILSRYPAQDELKTALDYTKTSGINKRQANIDLAWALLNSAEFVNRH